MRYAYLIILLLISCTQSSVKEEKAVSLVQDIEKSAAEVSIPLKKEVVCFVYHRFGDKRFPSTNVSIEDFESHLSWLTQHDYQVLTLSQAIDYLNSNEEIKRTAVLSVDDGYKSFFENGLPLLKKYKMPATLFINTETVGSGDYMDWKQLAGMLENNIEIGNHTHSHAYFLNQPPGERYKDFVIDIETSQKIIKQNLDVTPKTFAYPYGEFDEEMKIIVKAKGFKGAAAQHSGVVNQETDVFQIPRFPMSEAYSTSFTEKAKMRPLVVSQQIPEQHILSQGEGKPTLSLTINPKGLRVEEMQCFIQGSNCKLDIAQTSGQELLVKLQATSSIIARRRTLYTLTAPDSLGNWRWYSHLWVNPSVK